MVRSLEPILIGELAYTANSLSNAFASFRLSVSNTFGEPAVNRSEELATLIPFAGCCKSQCRPASRDPIVSGPPRPEGGSERLPTPTGIQ